MILNTRSTWAISFYLCPGRFIPVRRDTADGQVALQFTTLLNEADASIATGTGAIVAVVDLMMRGSTDTEVLIALPNHAYRIPTS
jgi:hypothetical protein